MGLFERLRSPQGAPQTEAVPSSSASLGSVPPPSMARPFLLWRRNDWPNQEVVGVSYRTEAIRALFPRMLPNDARLECEADLVREPSNPHDRQAVAVVVRGVHIGYLPRDVAPNYQALLQHLEVSAFRAQVLCSLRASEWIETVYDRNDHERHQTVFHCRASICLAEPHLCVPVNRPPTTAHVVIPQGSAIQVLGEEHHLDAIAPHVRPEGETWVHATLHAFIDETKKSRPELIEVRIDDRRVGQLTPKMSSELLPVVRHLGASGHLAVVRALVQGNRLKAEVTLFVMRSHELTSEWLASLPAGAPGVALAPPIAAMSMAAVSIPPRPTVRFNPPRGWNVPEGWEPPPGWTPSPDLPMPPPGWKFWVLQ